jgi:hypothetical protein
MESQDCVLELWGRLRSVLVKSASGTACTCGQHLGVVEPDGLGCASDSRGWVTAPGRSYPVGPWRPARVDVMVTIHCVQIRVFCVGKLEEYSKMCLTFS